MTISSLPDAQNGRSEAGRTIDRHERLLLAGLILATAAQIALTVWAWLS